MIGKYIGGKKIITQDVDLEQLTPGGHAIATAKFDDGSTELIPTIMYEAMMTDEPVDPSKLRDLRVMAISKAIVEVFAEYDMKLNEFDHVVQTLKMTLDENFGRATEILWKTSEKRWLDMWRILKENGQEMVS
jgi:hypothetical protein